MKGLIVLILIVLAIMAVLFMGKSQPAKPTRKAPPKQATTTTKSSPSTQTQAGSKQRGTQSAREPGAIESTINYGTGYTQMQVKKRQTSKLDRIQQQQNKAIGDAANQ